MTHLYIAWIVAAILLPVLLLSWTLESRSARIRRWRRNGDTWCVIAARLGCAQSTARRWACA
jgi:hypothetical protein